jgi:hypothetical protein
MRAARFIILLSGLAFGCGGPELGALASSEVRLTATAVAFEPETASIGEPRGGLGLTRVYLSTSSLTFVPCDARASEIALGPRSYELVADALPREVVSTTVTRLCELRFDIDPLAQNGAEGVPEGAAIYVEGADAEGSAFSFATEESSSIRLTASEDAPFGSDALLLTFDISSWLREVTLENLEKMPGAVHELVDARTPEAFALFADLNGDGALQEDEEPPVAAAPAR